MQLGAVAIGFAIASYCAWVAFLWTFRFIDDALQERYWNHIQKQLLESDQNERVHRQDATDCRWRD